MKLFGRTGGYYLFWTGFVYLSVGLVCALYFKQVPTELLQVIWISTLALPFTYPPLGRYFNLDIRWDQNMFDWFKKKDSKVVKFPTPEVVPPMPTPSEKEKPAHTYYRLGMTDNNRVSLQMGYSEITMNYDGVNNMIKQLEVFRDQIVIEDDRND